MSEIFSNGTKSNNQVTINQSLKPRFQYFSTSIVLGFQLRYMHLTKEKRCFGNIYYTIVLFIDNFESQ